LNVNRNIEHKYNYTMQFLQHKWKIIEYKYTIIAHLNIFIEFCNVPHAIENTDSLNNTST